MYALTTTLILPPAVNGGFPIDEGIIIFSLASVGNMQSSMVSLLRDPSQLSFGFNLSRFTPLDFNVDLKFRFK